MGKKERKKGKKERKKERKDPFRTMTTPVCMYVRMSVYSYYTPYTLYRLVFPLILIWMMRSSFQKELSFSFHSFAYIHIHSLTHSFIRSLRWWRIHMYIHTRVWMNVLGWLAASMATNNGPCFLTPTVCVHYNIHSWCIHTHAHCTLWFSLVTWSFTASFRVARNPPKFKCNSISFVLLN